MSQVFYDIAPQHVPLEAELREAFQRVVAKGHFIKGIECEAFEQEFAAYCGVRHTVGCSNGLDALQLILRAAGIGPGDEVIVPAHTFVATWMAVSAVGATPVGVDVIPDTGNISVEAAAAAVTSRTRALIAVHLYGRPADMPALRKLANRHHLLLVEDAAQAHGAHLDNRRCGALGDAAAFSFYPTKNLGALGDAGAVVTNDDALAARIRRISNYGSTRKYEHTEHGLNARLDELQAALLRVKLPHLDRWNALRQAIAQDYDRHLAVCASIKRPPLLDAVGGRTVWHLYVIRASNRDVLQKAISASGIETLVHYPIPPHRQSAYATSPANAFHFPEADAFCNTALSLPLYPGLTSEAIQSIAHAVCQAS